MKILVLFLAFLSTVVVESQVPKTCVAPKEMEARIVDINMERHYEVRSKLSYDAYNMRKRYVDEIFTADNREYFDILYLHNVGVEYRLNLKTKKCEVRKISTQEFYPIGVPRNATFYGEATIGTNGNPGEGVVVQSWGGETEHGHYHGTWTLLGCLPVKEGYFSNRTGYIGTEFYDITLGISDPNVFIPPKECM